MPDDPRAPGRAPSPPAPRPSPPTSGRRGPSLPAWPYPHLVAMTATRKGWRKSRTVDGRRQWKLFGPLDDPAGALDYWFTIADRWEAGAPLEDEETEGLPFAPTVLELATAFLDSRQHRVELGRLTRGQFVNYRRALALLVRTVGPDRLVARLAPRDFERIQLELADLSVHTQARTVREIRTAFRWARKYRRIAEPDYADAFDPPSPSAFRKARDATERRALEPRQVRRILAAATDPQARALVLLGINGAYGPADCARLRIHELDLEGGWIRARRKKTGIHRLVALWPETVRALAAVIEERPDDAASDAVFLNRSGVPYTSSRGTNYKAIGKRFRAAARRAGIPGAYMYDLRRTFDTIAARHPEETARRIVMGHRLPGLDEVYVLKLPRSRVRHVCEYVRRRVFGVRRREVRGAWSGIIPPEDFPAPAKSATKPGASSPDRPATLDPVG